MKLHVFLSMIVVATLSACSSTKTVQAEAEKVPPQVAASAGQPTYAEILPPTSNSFPAVTVRNDLEKVHATMRKDLGKLKSKSAPSWKLQKMNGESYMVKTQESVFEYGTATETSTYIMRDGKPILMGYGMKSSTVSAQ